MSEIVVKREGRVNTVRFNRIDKKNAITRAMYADLAAAVVETDQDESLGATLFLGQPEVYTSGNDLMDFMAVATGGAKGTEVIDFLRAIITSKKPMVAAVDGLAVGVGTTMLLHFDLVYASNRAWFQTPFTDLGLVPEAGSSLVAPRLMGQQEAFALLALGEKFSADRAKSAGLINQITDSDALESMAMDAADRLANKPPQALAIARELIRGNRNEIIARMEKEGQLFAERLMSQEAKEAFLAFMNKGKAA